MQDAQKSAVLTRPAPARPQLQERDPFAHHPSRITPLESHASGCPKSTMMKWTHIREKKLLLGLDRRVDAGVLRDTLCQESLALQGFEESSNRRWDRCG